MTFSRALLDAPSEQSASMAECTKNTGYSASREYALAIQSNSASALTFAMRDPTPLVIRCLGELEAVGASPTFERQNLYCLI